MAEFIVRKNGQLLKFTRFEDIPSSFDHLIKFLPDAPEPPHTDHEHEEIDQWNNKLQKLMEIERNASRDKNR